MALSCIEITAGLLQPVIQALGSFEGQKPVALAVRLSRVITALSEYHEAWNAEHLRPLIVEFTGGDTVVPDADLPAFLEAHSDVFNMEIPVELKAISLDELTIEGITVDTGAIGLLLHVGVVVD